MTIVELQNEYVTELRASKERAEGWWAEINDEYAANPGPYKPQQLWPLGPASHPWVIATYRKYFFLCEAWNREVEQLEEDAPKADAEDGEDSWGTELDESSDGTVAPKVFLLDLLSGGETQDLYTFLCNLVFIPIGMKSGETV